MALNISALILGTFDETDSNLRHPKSGKPPARGCNPIKPNSQGKPCRKLLPQIAQILHHIKAWHSLFKTYH
jgi:hypothetical protein